jgi:hypothetical protein
MKRIDAYCGFKKLYHPFVKRQVLGRKQFQVVMFPNSEKEHISNACARLPTGGSATCDAIHRCIKTLTLLWNPPEESLGRLVVKASHPRFTISLMWACSRGLFDNANCGERGAEEPRRCRACSYDSSTGIQGGSSSS